MPGLEIFRVNRHGEPGAGAEVLVRTRLGDAWRRQAKDEGVLYEQYPVWHEQELRTPDLLLLGAELGLVGIEVKGLRATQLAAMHGDHWEVRNYFKPFINPFAQAHKAVDLLFSNVPPHLPDVTRRVFVALPFVERGQCACAPKIPDPRILWAEDFADPDQLWERLRTAPAQHASVPALDAAAYREWRGILGRRVENINAPGDARPTKQELVKRHLVPFEQEREADLRGRSLEVPSGVLRLRGIAGSGKTVLLTQLAARLLECRPDFRIGLVFFTRSLHDQCFSLVQENLRLLLRGKNQELREDPEQHSLGLPDADGSIRVFNAWGGTRAADGFYSFMCQQAGATPLDFEKAREAYRLEFGAELGGGDLLPFLCRRLLASHGGAIKPCFDALFIDEGQDLLASSPALRWEEPGDDPGTVGISPGGPDGSDDGRSEAFFTLAYRALRPCDSTNPRQRRLIFAYDEAQSLDSLHIPSARRLFGPVLSGLFAGGRARNRIMHRSYRNPRPMLVAAHALGMGLLRKNGAVQTLNRTEWEAIGYEITGDLRRPQHPVTLLRPDKESPNPIPDHWRGARDALLGCHVYGSEADEIAALRDAVRNDLEQEGLDPCKEMLVIDLRGNPWAVAAALDGLPFGEKVLQCYVPGGRGARNRFRKPGQLTVTVVRRAKGNEAPMVYVVGLETLCDPGPAEPDADNELIRRRNKLFVCLTRARGWLRLSGVRIDKNPATGVFLDEVDAAIHQVLGSGGGTLEFFPKLDPDRKPRSLDHEDQMELDGV